MRGKILVSGVKVMQLRYGLVNGNEVMRFLQAGTA